MKVKYNRVKAYSCKEIISYIKKGYSPFVIDNQPTHTFLLI